MKYLLFILFNLLSLSLLAVPAKKFRQLYTLQDGTQKELTLAGDEFSHWYASDDGHCYLPDSDGVMIEKSQSTLKQRGETRSEVANRRRVNTKPYISSYQGKKKGLVILVNFSDKKMSVSNPQETFDKIFNASDYKGNGMYGSVHDYFYECSYGQFDLEFDVVGPVQVSSKMSYYGANDSEGSDKHPGQMVSEAVRMANSQVDYADYDWDGDGLVDQVYVVYAGYGENQGASENTVWPHEWDLYSASYYNDGSGPILLDGVYVNSYACSNELYGTSGTKVDGIGSACHEFSHCLGLPDFYDTEGSNFGMNAWDLLDYGCYNGDGYQPALFTSFERLCCGWLEPKELNKSSSVKSMQPLSESPEAYIIYNDNDSAEFYLLENHQQIGWESASYGHGLLIVHVDYSQDAWENNTMNNTASHQRMTIFHADNQAYTGQNNVKYYASLAGDPYPGTSGNTSFSDSSTPRSTLYNSTKLGTKFMSKPITNIQENEAGLISFDFMGGGPSPDEGDDNVKQVHLQCIESDDAMYCIDGCRTMQIPSHNVYIKNGKKYLTK